MAHAVTSTKLETIKPFAAYDTAIKQINWDDLDPRAIGFVKDYLAIHEQRLEKMKSWGLPYILMIEDILRRYKLPTSLKYLAVIESDLKSNALSVAGAVGPWQLMPQTARELGLKVNNRDDERTDLNLSTHAAARYLTSLYEKLGDWLLVIAAYNGGPARVESMVKRKNGGDFWAIQNMLPAESRNHVKKFIATHYIFERDGSETTGKLIQNNPVELLTDEEKVLTDTLTISGKYAGSVIAKTLGMDIVLFNKWNPDFDSKVVSQGFQMRLYKDKLLMFKAKRNEILQESLLMSMQQNLQYELTFPGPAQPNGKQIKKNNKKKD